MNANSNNPSKNMNKNISRQITRTEVVLAVLLVGTISYLIYFQTSHETGENSSLVEPSECPTPGCYESIIEIQSYIDESVDPCEDFNQFACGKFFENSYKTQVTAKIIQDQIEYYNELEGMIVQPVTNKDSEAIKIQKMFFQACVNVDKNDENHNKVILDIIDDVGEWPLRKTSGWVEKDFDWLEVTVRCKQLGLPFQWFLQFSLHEEDLKYLKISYPLLDSSAKANRTTVGHIMSNLLGKKVNAKTISDFEQSLINIIKKQKSETILTTVAELQTQHSVFPWLNFLNDITENNLDEDTQVASNVNEYIVDLYKLLNGTPKRIQADYIMWKIVEHFVPYLSNNVRKHGIPEIPKNVRTQFCETTAKKNFQYFAQIEYVRKYVNEEVKNFVTELTDLTRQEFLTIVEESAWRNTSLGQEVVNTFNNVFEVDVGFDLVNEDFLEANFWHIGNLTFDSDNPGIIEIITTRSKYFYESLFTNINTTALSPEITNFLQTMDVQYILFDSSKKRMVIPPAMLHGFLYENERPNYLNFASLGSLIAAEFIKSTQLVTNRCLEVDYEKTASEQTTFKSLDVIREVLPDVIGRHISYDVYQKWVTANGEETQLPLLSYSPNQLFWIKSSLINCHKKLTYTEDESDFNLMVSKYKNVLAVRHSRHFGGDFGCTENTKMNPLAKC